MANQTKTISLDKKYQTKSGKLVKITKIYEDNRIWSVEGELHKDGDWHQTYWTINGRYGNFPGDYDLVEIQESVPAPALISLDKQYQTRDGRPVKLLSLTDGSPEYPVVGICNPGTDDVALHSWKADGTYTHIGATDPSDLIEIPPQPPSCIPYRRYLSLAADNTAFLQIITYMNGDEDRISKHVESKFNFIRWIDPEPIAHPIQE